jgi:hypothetical protein
LTAALEAVALEHRGRAEVARYRVDRLVGHVVRQERAATWIPFGRAAPQAILFPYFGLETENRFREANNQRRAVKTWIRRNYVLALARVEIANRRHTAFAAEGLA